MIFAPTENERAVTRLMARLIDANSILDDFIKRYTKMERDGKLVSAACEVKQDFADMISNAETVDAVEVVRCHECKYAHLTANKECKYCDMWENEEALYLPTDFYCGYGERKDGDGNG